MDNSVAIVGSRDFVDYDLFCKVLNDYRKDKKIDRIVSGHCRGADTLAERYAEDNKIPILIFPAEWKKYDKLAGKIRNKKIVDNATELIAFPSKTGHGTQHTIGLARNKGIKITIINID